jgi:hypothetical protein
MLPILLIVVSFPPGGPAPPQPTVVQRQPNGVILLSGAHIENGQIEVRLRDELTLVIEVEAPAYRDVVFPPKLTRSAGWVAQLLGPPRQTPLPKERVRWQQTYEVEPRGKGTLSLLVEPVRSREDIDRPLQPLVTWDPISLVVTTSLGGDPAEAEDITGIQELPQALAEPSYWPAALIGVVALMLVVLLWLWWRRPWPLALPLSPARAALLQLERVPLPQATIAEVASYHTRLAEVVRRYFERWLQLPASHQTTRELLEALGSAPRLTLPQQELLRDFLERCDRGKFAPVALAREECQATAALARRLIEETASAAGHLQSAAVHITTPPAA